MTKTIARQMTLDEALEARDKGMDQVEENAEKLTPDFAPLAYAFIVKYLSNGHDVSAEDINTACCNSGIIPHDDRAFGPVYLKLMRDGRIVKTGTGPRRKGHGAPGATIWRINR